MSNEKGVATLERRSKRQDIGVADLVRCGIASRHRSLLRDRWREVERLAISSVHRMPERSMRSLIRFLQAPSTGPLAIGQPLARYSW